MKPEYSSEDFDVYDQCHRKQTWGAKFLTPRISLTAAMYQSLREGLLAGSAEKTREHFMGLAAKPGIDITAYNLYELVVHHASLMEIVTAYLLAGGEAWKQAPSVNLSEYKFHPLSYLLPDGRLRRVVLCDSWNALREKSETISWRTVADCVATNRPMLLNAISIGQSRKGFRTTPWTTGYQHPENKTLRVQRKEGTFNESWKRVRREHTEKKPLEWMKIMQQDGSFENLVHSVTVDMPPRSSEVLEDMQRIAREMNSGPLHPSHSACYRFGPCGFSEICHSPQLITPESLRWRTRWPFDHGA